MKKFGIILAMMLTVFALSHCSKTDADAIGTTGTATTSVPAGAANTSSGALPLKVNTPGDNLQTPEKIALGKLLFWDPILSGNNDVACGTCHHPAFGYSDGLDLSIGVNGQGLGLPRHFLSPNTIPFAKRNALTIINSAFNGMSANGLYDPVNAVMFFDNRSKSLELQSLEPIKTLEEMKGTRILANNILDSVIDRLKNSADYVRLFNNAFQTTGAISIQNLGKVIACFERSIISNHAPYDEYMRGNTTAMTAVQVQGMNLFISTGCAKCHSGPMFSDYALHVLSVPDNAKLPADAGANGAFSFRTPSLRNLAVTAPYMHSGVFASLNDVMDFYDRVGGGRSQNGLIKNNQLDPDLRGLNNNNKNAIIQFLNALNDTNFDKQVPVTVPSGLHPGGNL